MLGVIAVLVLVLVPAATGASPTPQLVSFGINGGAESGDFVVETVDGTTTATVPFPDGVSPIGGSFLAPAANGSIAFIAGDNAVPSAGDQGSLWLVGANQSPVHLDSSTWDTDPTISPDGTKIAFARFDPTTWSQDIYVVNADGSDLKLIASGEGANDLRIPKFSPDGKSIAYWCGPAENGVPTAGFKGCGPMMDGTYRTSGVMLMNADGSDKRMILIGAGDPVEPVGPSELSWSPDGQWLTFDGDQRVCPCGSTYGYLRQVFEYKTDGSDLFNNLDPTDKSRTTPTQSALPKPNSAPTESRSSSGGPRTVHGAPRRATFAPSLSTPTARMSTSYTSPPTH